MDVCDYNDPNASRLTDEDKANLASLLKKVQALLPEVRMPMDPKIYPLLEVIGDIIQTQIELELHFTYDDVYCGDDASDAEVNKAAQQVKKECKKKEKKPKKPTKPPEDLEDYFKIED